MAVHQHESVNRGVADALLPANQDLFLSVWEDLEIKLTSFLPGKMSVLTSSRCWKTSPWTDANAGPSDDKWIVKSLNTDFLSKSLGKKIKTCDRQSCILNHSYR